MSNSREDVRNYKENRRNIANFKKRIDLKTNLNDMHGQKQKFITKTEKNKNT